MNEPDEIITDEEANILYTKVTALTQGRKCYSKKNWSEEETKLLKWAVNKYTQERQISFNSLVSVAAVTS